MRFATKLPVDLLGLDSAQVWDTGLAFKHLRSIGKADSKRTAERRLKFLNLLPGKINQESLLDEIGRVPNVPVLKWALATARKQRKKVLFIQQHPLPGGQSCLHANDARGARYWIPIKELEKNSIKQALDDLQRHTGKAIAIFPHGSLVSHLREASNSENVRLYPQVYQAILPTKISLFGKHRPELPPSKHLKQLEAESIHIIREAVAEAQNPAMLYSIGKDSGVMLHLAFKAFYPARPPFPLLHIDTRWKFRQMYQFREFVARTSGMDLLVYVNPEAIARDINPFEHGSALHTEITKTVGLKNALDQYKFDVVLGGARRDEEKSRSKERVFSFRSASHRWDPKLQRPELWNLYNTRKGPNESIRVFPLSNWTELDIWHYIYCENIPVVPLYFAEPRPVIIRPDMIMLVDDDRCRLLPGEEIKIKKVRFRTLGCYPLTGAIESEAESLEDVLREIIHAEYSERQGRKIDGDSIGSMEKKKQDGYF